MSGDNDTRLKTWVQKWLKEFCVGAANGISAKKLARLIDCTERKLRKPHSAIKRAAAHAAASARISPAR